MSDDADRTPESPFQPTPPDASTSVDRSAETRPIQPVPPGMDPAAAGNHTEPESETRSIQPAPPGVDTAAETSTPDSEPQTQRIQPVPPDHKPESTGGSSTGVDVPTAEMSLGPPAEANPVQPKPSSLYDVPWQPAAEPIPEWITTQAAESPTPEPTTVAPAARPPADAAVQQAGYTAAGRRSEPPGSYYGGAAAPAPDRPRRAGIIAASVVALAVVLVGGGVIGLLATRGNGDGSEAGGATSTVPGAVDPTAATTPLTPAPTAPPPTPVPPSSPPTPIPTTAPPTAPPTVAPPGSPNTVPGDLSLAEPMRRPACDGQYIVITANAVTPGEYQRQVVEAQQRFVGAAYLKTDQTCPSLRPTDDLGNAIYSIYYGPFPTLADACRIRAQVGGDSYIKILDQVTPFTKIWDCE